MIENWIDALAKVWEISDGKGGLVKSYRLFELAELPESLSVYPCAITYPIQVDTHIGSASYDIWTGITEFHINPTVAKTGIADVLRYFSRIKTAAAANVTLGGLVSYFTLQETESIQGPLAMDYGEQAPGMGLIVRWIIKENEPVTVGG